MRNQILRQIKMFDDLASAMFAALQNAKYFKPVFLGQQLQNLCGLRKFFLAVVIFATFRFHISIYIDILSRLKCLSN